MATYWENSCSFGSRYVSWYKCLIVSCVFSHLGFWSGNLFLIAPFPDLWLLVPFYDHLLWQCLYGPINCYHSFCWSYLILCLHNTDTLDMCMKKYYLKKIFLTKFQLLKLDNFLCKFSTFIIRCADTGRSTPTTAFM